MDALLSGLVLVHAGISALWMGSMAYSLFVVQPKLAKMVGAPAVPNAGPEPAVRQGSYDERVEEAQRILAHGNRWPVVALIAVLWVTGIALALLAEERSTGWWLVLAGKTVLLATATGLFWWVSWRGWPRRVFALPAELPGLQRRFRRVALLMFGLVGAAYALGVTTAAG